MNIRSPAKLERAALQFRPTQSHLAGEHLPRRWGPGPYEARRDDVYFKVNPDGVLLWEVWVRASALSAAQLKKVCCLGGGGGARVLFGSGVRYWCSVFWCSASFGTCPFSHERLPWRFSLSLVPFLCLFVPNIFHKRFFPSSNQTPQTLPSDGRSRRRRGSGGETYGRDPTPEAFADLQRQFLTVYRDPNSSTGRPAPCRARVFFPSKNTLNVGWFFLLKNKQCFQRTICENILPFPPLLYSSS